MGRGAWHPRRQDQIGRRSHRAGEGSGGQVAELKPQTATPKSLPLCLRHRWSGPRVPVSPAAMLGRPTYPSAEPQER